MAATSSGITASRPRVPGVSAPEASRAAGLSAAKARSGRPNDAFSNPNPMPSESLPRSNAVTNAQQQLRSGGLRNPPEMQKALQLAKQIGHGRRDKSKSLTDQAIGEASARGGQALGGFVGTAIPVLGSTVGAMVGKRVGRLAGENWKKTLIILAVAFFFSVLPFLLLITTIATVIMAGAKRYGLD